MTIPRARFLVLVVGLIISVVWAFCRSRPAPPADPISVRLLRVAGDANGAGYAEFEIKNGFGRPIAFVGMNPEFWVVRVRDWRNAPPESAMARGRVDAKGTARFSVPIVAVTKRYEWRVPVHWEVEANAWQRILKKVAPLFMVQKRFTPHGVMYSPKIPPVDQPFYIRRGNSTNSVATP